MPDANAVSASTPEVLSEAVNAAGAITLRDVGRHAVGNPLGVDILDPTRGLQDQIEGVAAELFDDSSSSQPIGTERAAGDVGHREGVLHQADVVAEVQVRDVLGDLLERLLDEVVRVRRTA